MINYTLFYALINQFPALSGWLETLPNKVQNACLPNKHGEINRWEKALDKLPRYNTWRLECNQAIPKIGDQLPTDEKNHLESILRQFHPWRKGPFNLFDIVIDGEWRCDQKWQRLASAVDMTDKLVLDVGSGNGYYCLRMLGSGAKLVIGIEPLLHHVMQFQVLKQCLAFQPKTDILPLSLEEMPVELPAFEVVFSMGVLYHRRSPIDHLQLLRTKLLDQGELILETLIIEGKNGEFLMPEGRYAKMRNVWFIPSIETLKMWLKRTGFHSIKVIDVSITTAAEQRRTDWMQFESLSNFLDPEHSELTMEGYPAPKRAILSARK